MNTYLSNFFANISKSDAIFHLSFIFKISMGIVHKEVCMDKYWKKYLPALRLYIYSGLLHRHKILFVPKHYVCSKNHTYCEELWFPVLYHIILQWQWKRLKSIHRDLTNEIHIQPFNICGSGSFVSIQWHSTMHINILLLIPRANMLSDLSLYHSSEVYLHSSSNKV